MNVDVIVPLGGDCPYRERAWDWVQARWADRFPDWRVITGGCEGPWSKAAAVADALRSSTADLLVIADADIWVDDVDGYIEAIREGPARWGRPHFKVYRLNEQGTARVLAGEEPADVALDAAMVEQLHAAMLGGGLVIVPRDLYDECPLDPRFTGWGQEDYSWGLALCVLGGKRRQGTELLWHLWHPPAPRRDRVIGSAASEQLRDRYDAAAVDRDSMRALIEEGRAWRSRTSS